MHTIGIDHQRTHTALCLREAGSARAASIGDGWRAMVPNAFAEGGLWGSAALLAGAAPDAPESAPWLAPGPFWKHLAERIFRFLGHVRPTRRNGYRVVVALPGHSLPHASALAEFWAEAGLEHVTVISSLDALLVRWMQSRAGEQGERTVALACVGDAGCDVGAWRVRLDGRGRGRALAAGETERIDHTGLAWWARRLIGLVRERFNEPLPPEQEAALFDAAFEFGMRLGAGEEEWDGLFRERIYSPLKVSLADCRSWPEATILEGQLATALRRAWRALGAAKADHVVLGGPGAAWPLALACVGEMAGVWRSEGPALDIAQGAAFWEEGHRPELLAARQAAEEAAPAPAVVKLAEGDEVPPWRRRLEGD